MRNPLRSKGARQQITSVQSISAPNGGWNTRDSVANMAPNDALDLTNWFPRTTDCKLRGGYSSYATTITGTVKTLAVYNALSGSNQFFAFDQNDAWDISSSGAASAQSTTVTNGKFQTINFGDGTNNYLICVNGVDAPLYYNGTSWTVTTGASSPSLSGPTLTNLIHVNAYKDRLFFIEKSTLKFWYLGAAAAGGILTSFDLSSIATMGGYLMWMATWTFDSGAGPDDYAVFMTSEGQVVVYTGTDPSSASAWSLVGVYYLGKPLGRRSFLKFGGDLIAITQNGIFPLAQALKSEQIDQRVAFSDKINSTFTSSSQTYGSNFGWEGIVYPYESAVLFNIPVAEDGTHYQYVMNTITKSWCNFDSWNAECFCLYNNELYFGQGSNVYKAWTGYDDNGNNIISTARTAFNYFGNESQTKRFNLFRPMLQTNGDIAFLTKLDVDFEDNEYTGLASYSTTSSAKWDVSYWDLSYWASGLDIVKKWTSPINNVGYCVSAGIKIESNNLEIHWIASDFVFEQGGVL